MTKSFKIHDFISYSAKHQTTQFTNRIHHIFAKTDNILNKIQASDQH